MCYVCSAEIEIDPSREERNIEKEASPESGLHWCALLLIRVDL